VTFEYTDSEHAANLIAAAELEKAQERIAELEAYKDQSDKVVRLEMKIADLEATAAQQVADFKREIDIVRKLKVENERLRLALKRMNERLRNNCILVMKDAERYRRWKAEGLSFSNGFYHLSIYVGHDEMEWTDADDVTDKAIDAAMEGE